MCCMYYFYCCLKVWNDIIPVSVTRKDVWTLWQDDVVNEIISARVKSVVCSNSLISPKPCFLPPLYSVASWQAIQSISINGLIS